MSSPKTHLPVHRKSGLLAGEVSHTVLPAPGSSWHLFGGESLQDLGRGDGLSGEMGWKVQSSEDRDQWHKGEAFVLCFKSFCQVWVDPVSVCHLPLCSTAFYFPKPSWEYWGGGDFCCCLQGTSWLPLSAEDSQLHSPELAPGPQMIPWIHWQDWGSQTAYSLISVLGVQAVSPQNRSALPLAIQLFTTLVY